MGVSVCPGLLADPFGCSRVKDDINHLFTCKSRILIVIQRVLVEK